MAVRLGRFIVHCGVLPTTQFAYRKGLGTCDALLCVSHTLQSALESGQEAMIVQIDFSTVFATIREFSIGSALWVSEAQFVLVDGRRSKLVNVVSGVPQGSVLGPLLFLLYTSVLFSILENKIIGYADDSTFMAVVPSPGAPVMVAESLNRDLVRVNA